MKYLSILLLFTSFNVLANFIDEINCGSFENSKKSNKVYFKGYTETELSELGVDSFFKQFTDVPYEQSRLLLSLIDRKQGSYKKTLPDQYYDPNEDVVIIDSVVQPHVVFRLGNKILAGSNNGEFGGELVLIDENDNVKIINKMNVEDIYQMPFGVVVTSGLAHISSNDGSIHLITAEFELQKLFGLIGMPNTSWLLENGDLLINSYPSGSQVLTKTGNLKRVQCIANKPLN